MLSRRWPLLLVLAIFVSLSTYFLILPRLASQRLEWKPVAMDLPPSITVYSASSPFAPVGNTTPRAWYVDIDYNDRNLQVRTHLSKSPTGRESAGAMAKRLDAIVAINGGYFDMWQVPASTYSLVRSDGKTLVPNIAVVKRSGPQRAYPVTRSAFGVNADRKFDVAWVAQQPDGLWAYPRPVAHTMKTVAAAPTTDSPAGGHLWDVVDAVGAGPTLISEGVIQDTYENEVFFGSGFTSAELYPRAAVGYTANNHLILFSTDGRQFYEQGLTLPQLAREMQRLGCIEAMNLDGGGSETLAINGKVINQYEGRERPVTSVLAILSKERAENRP